MICTLRVQCHGRTNHSARHVDFGRKADFAYGTGYFTIITYSASGRMMTLVFLRSPYAPASCYIWPSIARSGFYHGSVSLWCVGCGDMKPPTVREPSRSPTPSSPRVSHAPRAACLTVGAEASVCAVPMTGLTPLVREEPQLGHLSRTGIHY